MSMIYESIACSGMHIVRCVILLLVLFHSEYVFGQYLLLLFRPAATYTPWFATVLKTCRVAVKVIHMLVEEVRTV